MKAGNGWRAGIFTELLEFLKEIFLEDNTLSNCNYEVKKILCPMGIEYNKIHVCPNDSILYKYDYEKMHKCPTCEVSRYKVKDGDSSCNVIAKGPSMKVLWYLPIISRFKQLFANVNDTENIRWHVNERKCDGQLFHQADILQWKRIDSIYLDSNKEPRNIRLGLDTNGMNPYGNLSSIHSSCPVLLVIYNVPPWLFKKRKYVILSLMISGPKQLGNYTNVCLGPLIEDLKKQWVEGVDVFDGVAHCFSK